MSFIIEDDTVNSRDENGNTALHRVAYDGNLDMMKMLVSRGAKFCRNNDDVDPAMMAVRNGNFHILRELCRIFAIKIKRSERRYKNVFLDAACADIKVATFLGYKHSCRDVMKNSQLALAVKSGRYDNVAYYLTHNNAYEDKAMILAIKYDRVECVKLFLPHKFFNIMETVTFALKKGNYDIVKLFVENADSHDKKFRHVIKKSLKYVAKNGNVKCGRYVLSAGADIEHYNGRLMTPLHIAIERGHESFAKFLINSGANVEATDQDNETALMYAARYGHLSTVKEIIIHGGTFDKFCMLGYSTVDCACMGGHIEVVKYLHEQGADIRSDNDKCSSIAFINGYVELVKYLHEN